MKCPCCKLEIPATSTNSNIQAQFIGKQKTDFGSFRLYNIMGDHRLNQSIVTIDTLIKEGIEIPDLTKEEVQIELKAIQKFMEA